jgi:tetratricopeptide (TPR) repeat protein
MQDGAEVAQALPEHDIAVARDLFAAGRREAAIALLRSLPGRAGARSRAAAATISASQADPAFRAIAARADAERDAGDWHAAVVLYGQALALYPLHAGYLVQLGHCLKEQGAFAQAELAYRSGLALGAPSADLHDHIRHVCALQAAPEAPIPTTPAGTDAPLAHLPTGADVELLFLLLRGRRAAAPEVLALLRTAPSCAAVVEALAK